MKVLDRLSNWLAANAPATVAAARPPATAQDMANAESTLGFTLPAVVHQIYHWHDGGANSSFDALWLTPGFGFSSLRIALNDWKRRCDGAAEEESDPDWDDDVDLNWNDRWFPIGTSWTGDLLVVDCSDTPTHGTVTIAGNEGPMASDPTWPNLEALLQELVEALENGTELDDHVPTIEDGRLAWQ
jgi:cell wall assembly regulator SMI1